MTNSLPRGGARPGSGGTKQNIHLDRETALMLREIAKRTGETVDQVVARLVREEQGKTR